MPSAFSRRRSRPANLAGGYVAANPAPCSAARPAPDSIPQSSAAAAPATVGPSTPETSRGHPNALVDRISTQQGLSPGNEEQEPSPSSPLPPTTPLTVQVATRTIEKKVRKSQLASSWEGMDPSLPTEEWVKGVIRRASMGATGGDANQQAAAPSYLAESTGFGSEGGDTHDFDDVHDVYADRVPVSGPAAVDSQADVDRKHQKSVLTAPSSQSYTFAPTSAAEDDDLSEELSTASTADLPLTIKQTPVAAKTTPFAISKQKAAKASMAGTNISMAGTNMTMVGTDMTNKAAQREPQQQMQGSALHMSDMIVGGQNCMIDHQPKSATKLHTMRTTFQSSLHDPHPSTNYPRTEDIIRTPAAAFKGEREAMISDLSEVWRQVGFLERELQKVNKKNIKMSTMNRAIVEKLASEVRSNREELERTRQKAVNDNDSIKALSRDLTFANAEKRRLHHLATTKNLAQKKTGERVAQIVADKLTRLNKIKNQSDARGDDLASTVVDLRRQHTSVEGQLMSEIHDLKGTIHVLKTELKLTNEAHASSSDRTLEIIRKNDSLTDDFNLLQASLRVSEKVKEKDNAEIDRLRNHIGQIDAAQERALNEWKDRCVKVEEKEKYASQHLIDREKELDQLRDKIAGAVNDAEGEVRVSRAEAEALKERCIALEEQNEALVDRYREAEVIMRKEGVRFDGTMKRLVDEMRARDDLGREFLEERRLLNKQWEKREKEIIMALKREARKVELKDEAIKQQVDELDALRRQAETLAIVEHERRGIKRGAVSPVDLRASSNAADNESNSFPLLPSELENKVGVLQDEVDRLRRENEKLLSGFMEKDEGQRNADQFQMKEVMPSAVRSRGRAESYRGSPLAESAEQRRSRSERGEREEDEGTISSTDEANDLYEAFKEGGVGRMTSEVRKMVSQSGKLLGKIQMLEGLKGAAEKEDGKGAVDGDTSVATSAFMSPYLFEK